MDSRGDVIQLPAISSPGRPSIRTSVWPEITVRTLLKWWARPGYFVEYFELLAFEQLFVRAAGER